MSFDEAIEFKKSIGNIFIENEIPFSVNIYPEKHEECKKMADHFGEEYFNDEIAKSYSSDNRYMVLGFYTDFMGLYIWKEF